MAFIYHKKHKVLTECRNEDVIKLAKKDPDTYIVNDNKEKIKKLIEIENDEEETTQESKSLKDMKINELKELAKKKGLEGVDSLKKEELLQVLEGDF